MDGDDSQDELINYNASHGKGKRAAAWAISDDSDTAEEDSGDGNSDTGEEEEEEDIVDGEEDEDEDEEEEDDSDDDEEEEEGKALEGAVGGTSADPAGLSSDEDTERCPICLNSFNSQPVATPESCEHYFCLDCILEWSKNANSCPVDRIVFSNIYLRKCYGGKVQKMITVQKPVKEGQEEPVNLQLEQTSCEVCGGSDREDRLLLCDGCDAGYHMECLTPPLDAVPVEEWFCPECEANNRHSRGSAGEQSETDSLLSDRPTTSRSRRSPAGATRAIARTQQSERVRASVNRHRITQARTTQLAPRYMMQSTWLDETINAVVAGLNTAVYVRDLTPRATPSRRRRTVKRRKGRKKTTSSAKGTTGKAASTGVKRRRRKVRRKKSRRRVVVKKQATPRDRIARSIGIGKPKNGSSLPTVYRPAEHSLGSMRADIGASSFSVYGDPFDLDDYDGEEPEEQQACVTTLLEAKRRGISHSALRSHQPVARPFTAGLSRRAVSAPQAQAVVEPTPMPDLLGSILSGQSMLLMDSSDVVINRDGSLKAIKSVALSTSLMPGRRSSGETSTQVNLGMSPNLGDLPGSSHSPLYTSSSSQSSPHLSPFTPSSSSPSQSNHTHPPSVAHPRLQGPNSYRANPAPGLGHRGAHEVGVPRGSHRGTSSTPDTRPRGLDMALPPSQPKKASAKPVWEGDVSVLPRIPKIKRESNGVMNGCSKQDGSNSSSSSGGSSTGGETRNITSQGSSSNANPTVGMHSLAGNESKQNSVDQQQGRTEGQAQRHRPDRAGSSSSFSNSFSSSSSSSTSSQATNRPCSSSSSTVSFRINSSRNSWQARRLSGSASSTATGGSEWEPGSAEEEADKKKRQQRDKQKLLTSQTAVKKEQEDIDTYDPFDPTQSDSDSSDGDGESRDLNANNSNQPDEKKLPVQGSKDILGPGQRRLEQAAVVKTERVEIEISQEESRRPDDLGHGDVLREDRGFGEHVKIEKGTASADTKVKTQTVSARLCQVKKEPGLDDVRQPEGGCPSLKKTAKSEATVSIPCLPVKTERMNTQEETGHNVQSPNRSPATHRADPSTSTSTSHSRKPKAEVKSEPRKSPERSKSPPLSQSPAKPSGLVKKPSKGGRSPKGHRSASSSPETGRRKGDQKGSSHTVRRRERDDDGDSRSRRSRSRERRRAHSPSDGSHSPDRSHKRKRRSRSRSTDRRRSRSASRSSSRERSRRNKHKRGSRERNDRGDQRDRERVSKDNRRARSRSRSRSRTVSKSRSRSGSRSRERRKGHARHQPSSSSRDHIESRSKDKKRPRSRSRSRERRKEEGSSKSLQKASGSSQSSSKETKDVKDRKRERDPSASTQSSKSLQKASGSSQSSSKETKEVKDKKRERDPSLSTTKEGKEAQKKKRETPSSSSSSGVSKHAPKSHSQTLTAKPVKEPEIVKEINKDKSLSLDIFEDLPVVKRVKVEESEMSPPPPPAQDTVELKDIIKGQLTPIKIEISARPSTTPSKTMQIKEEPSFPESPSHSPLNVFSSSSSSSSSPSISTYGTVDSVQGLASQSPQVPLIPTISPATIVSTAPVKQDDAETLFTASPEQEDEDAEPQSTAPVEQEDSEPQLQDAETQFKAPVKQEDEEPQLQDAETQSTAPVKQEDAEPQLQHAETQSTAPVKHEDAEPQLEDAETQSTALVKQEDVEPQLQDAETQSTALVKQEDVEPQLQDAETQSTAPVKQEDAEPQLQDAETQSTAPVKQEDAAPLSDSDEEDFNVDMMLDSLDFVKSEKVAEGGTAVKQEKEGQEVKSEGGQVSVQEGAKAKAPVKRVTWNIQEPEGPQPEKTASKLALYKLKLKQEGARRPSSSTNIASQDVAGAAASDPSKKGSVTAGSLSASNIPPDRPNVGQKEYLKKLHMQERAVEEVKLALKPYYQKRDISKDEYKEILRKAVQKVCHSKSGEINPVKVANLVKAYVDKYKHARKYRKDDDDDDEEAPEIETEGMINTDSP